MEVKEIVRDEQTEREELEEEHLYVPSFSRLDAVVAGVLRWLCFFLFFFPLFFCGLLLWVVWVVVVGCFVGCVGCVVGCCCVLCGLFWVVLGFVGCFGLLWVVDCTNYPRLP